MKELKAGVFDINGTIQENNGIPADILDAFHYLGCIGLRTTVATGRGYKRALELLEGHFDDIVSPGMPLVVENGGRIVDANGANLAYHALSTDLRDNALDVVDTNVSEIDYIAYYPKQSERNIEYWSSDGSVAQNFVARHGLTARVHSGRTDLLAKRIRAHKPCMLIVKPKDMALAGLFVGANVELNEGELNVLNQGVNKGSGVSDVAMNTGIPIEQFIVAGNDHNDRSMFELSAGLGIFVGDKTIDFLSSRRLTRVATPALLGRYLQEAIRAAA